MSFTYEISARFHEVDRAGIVFYGRAFEYAHVCFEEMLTAAFGGFDRVFDTMHLGLPLVNAHASFGHPMRRGDRLLAELFVERLTQRSITFRCVITGQADGIERCIVHQKHAFVSFPDFQPVARPDAFTDGLLAIGMELPEV